MQKSINSATFRKMVIAGATLLEENKIKVGLDKAKELRKKSGALDLKNAKLTYSSTMLSSAEITFCTI